MTISTNNILTLDGNKILSFLKNVIFILSFSFLTGVAAGLKIEIGIIPITMQTLVVLLSGFFLGSKKGALSQLTYLVMGVSGIFWFSHGGGLAYVLSPTFGYVIGFILAAFLVGFICERFGNNFKNVILAISIGGITLYIPGILWLAYFIGFEKSLIVGFYPFIIGDVLKAILAGSIISLIRR